MLSLSLRRTTTATVAVLAAFGRAPAPQGRPWDRSGFTGGTSLRASAAHAFAIGVEDWLCDGRCSAALTENFQLKALNGAELGGNVAEG
jgi:hypothetical protein